MGKPVGNGVPLGVVVTRSEILDDFLDATFMFSTFGGNPVSCAAGLAVLDVIEREGLVENSRIVGEYFSSALGAIDHPLVTEIRGTGLLIALELDVDREQGNRLLELMRENGVLVGTAGRNRNVLKLRPPLVAKRPHIDDFIAALGTSLSGLI